MIDFVGCKGILQSIVFFDIILSVYAILCINVVE